MLISTEAKTPNSFEKLIADFKLSNPQIVFLFRIKLQVKRQNRFRWFGKKSSFCGTYSEDLYQLLFNFSTVRVFSNRCTVWWSDLCVENLSLTLKGIIIGILHRTDVLNYLITLGKITIWESRKNKISPNFRLFLHKVKAKQEVEKIIAIKNRKLRDINKRWELLL